MSKAILISINPKHVMNILNGKKTIELRKTYPHCALPIDVYIYCTKSNTQYLVGSKDKVCDILTKRASDRFSPNIENYIGNGKVVAKFTLNHVNMDFLNNVLEPACVSRKEAEDYLEGRPCWQWKIDNLVVFDKPKLLKDFHKVLYRDKTGYCIEYGRVLTRAPQSWQYVDIDNEKHLED